MSFFPGLKIIILATLPIHDKTVKEHTPLFQRKYTPLKSKLQELSQFLVKMGPGQIRHQFVGVKSILNLQPGFPGAVLNR